MTEYDQEREGYPRIAERFRGDFMFAIARTGKTYYLEPRGRPLAVLFDPRLRREFIHDDYLRIYEPVNEEARSVLQEAVRKLNSGEKVDLDRLLFR